MLSLRLGDADLTAPPDELAEGNMGASRSEAALAVLRTFLRRNGRSTCA